MTQPQADKRVKNGYTAQLAVARQREAAWGNDREAAVATVLPLFFFRDGRPYTAGRECGKSRENNSNPCLFRAARESRENSSAKSFKKIEDSLDVYYTVTYTEGVDVRELKKRRRTMSETTAHILVKCNKADSVFQRILVREGEYLHPQLFKWFTLPTEWEKQARKALKKAAKAQG